jgi:hypothetical protein
MGILEKNSPTLPIRSPQLRCEIAAVVGLIRHHFVRRMRGQDDAGGAREIRTCSTVLIDRAQQPRPNLARLDKSRPRCPAKEIGPRGDSVAIH